MTSIGETKLSYNPLQLLQIRNFCCIYEKTVLYHQMVVECHSFTLLSLQQFQSRISRGHVELPWTRKRLCAHARTKIAISK